MKLNENYLPQIRFILVDEPLDQKYGAQYTSYQEKYGRLPDVLQFDTIQELESIINLLSNMFAEAKEFRDNLDKCLEE